MTDRCETQTALAIEISINAADLMTTAGKLRADAIYGGVGSLSDIWVADCETRIAKMIKALEVFKRSRGAIDAHVVAEAL